MILTSSTTQGILPSTVVECTAVVQKLTVASDESNNGKIATKSQQSLQEQDPEQIEDRTVSTSMMSDESKERPALSESLPFELQSHADATRLQTFWNDIFGGDDAGKHESVGLSVFHGNSS